MSLSIFNNPDIVAKGWYVVCPSASIPTKHVQSFDLCGQRIAIFRGADHQVRALEAYCPHMGTDLGIGDVVGDRVRCFFHHWAFDGEGNCQDIPCQKQIPSGAQIQSYATEEKYGFVWVYPEAVAPNPVAEFDELRTKPVVTLAGKSLTRHCHHHVYMMNPIDRQHVEAIQQIKTDTKLTISENAECSSINFSIDEKRSNRGQIWLAHRLLDRFNSYSVSYVNGCLGLLSLKSNVRWLRSLHIIYGYVPLENGSTRVQPIYVTRKRRGLLGKLVSLLLLYLTQLCDRALHSKDNKIYDNIRFDAKNLLPIDRPLVAYINHIEQLEPSAWSKCLPAFASALPNLKDKNPTDTTPPKASLLSGGVTERSKGRGGFNHTKDTT